MGGGSWGGECAWVSGAHHTVLLGPAGLRAGWRVGQHLHSDLPTPTAQDTGHSCRTLQGDPVGAHQPLEAPASAGSGRGKGHLHPLGRSDAACRLSPQLSTF